MAKKSARKRRSPWLYVAALAFLILLAGTYYFAGMGKNESAAQLPSDIPLEPINSSSVSIDEQQQIEAWIVTNDLNQYGDPKDTVYAGGTPLFNESTGEYTQRYEYIVAQHSDKLTLPHFRFK